MIIGNPDNPKYVFVFPHLRKTDKRPCSDKTISYLLEHVKDATVYNSWFIAWIEEPIKKIYAKHRKEYTPKLLERLNEIKPEYIITFDEDLPKELLDWPNYESLRQNHGTFFKHYYDEDSFSWVFPVHGFALRRYYEYRKIIEFDLSERLAIDPNSVELPPYEIVKCIQDISDDAIDYQNVSKCYLDIETTGLDNHSDEILMVGMSFDNGSDKVYVMPRPTEDQCGAIIRMIAYNNLTLVGHNIKFDLHFLIKKGNVSIKDIPKQIEDTMLYSQIVGEESGFQNLKHLSNKYNMRLGNNSYKGNDGFDSIKYLVEDVHTTKLLHQNLGRIINEQLCN